MNTHRIALATSLFLAAHSAFAAKPSKAKVKLVAQSENAPAKTEAPPVKDAPSTKPSATDKSLDDRSVAIAVDLVSAFKGVASISAEGKLSRRVGLAGIVSGGAPLVTKSTRQPLLEAGISPRFYLVGHFDHGLQLGADVRGALSWNDAATAISVSAIPYLGYKVTAPVGLVVEVQMGCGYQFAFAQGNGTTATASGIAPMVNGNFGWAF